MHYDSCRKNVWGRFMGISVTIDKRFCGPKHSANGGYAAGVFAQLIDGPAEVTLKSPPPLDAPILLQEADGGYDAVYDGGVIASARPAVVEIDAPELPDDTGVQCAQDAFLSDSDGVHLIPYCFVCGNRREAGDGLRIFSGAVPDSPVNADFWAPTPDLADGDGYVRPEFLWAALDCPSAFAMRNWPALSLLGRLSVDVRRRPKAGERLVAAGWPRGQDGRKLFSSSALYTSDKEIIAAANAVWVELNDPAMLAKLAADRQ